MFITQIEKQEKVSILVLVDYALEPIQEVISDVQGWVSILVLVDYALEQYQKTNFKHQMTCFNPCFSGLCFGAIAEIKSIY